ncbi:hypothetical protein MKW94_022173 [Papaver nudicaule]|uniref:Agenet domain-containing protein n=1 Tax=Papaver nudicaule TaxID=74823 RepID=A0AA41VB56_PAPNU|nr:hypothetical protein [Papaver nudicaule]
MKFVDNLPFEVGQLVESKSFLEGYRGAWFRCKIKDHKKRCGEHSVALEYSDFPDEKITWINLYRLSPAERNLVSKRKYLMLRPSYPQIYHQNQIPDAGDISEIIAIVDGTWKVGDMVDWFKDDCYWSACITNVQDEENIQIQIPEHPVGEGGSYAVRSKDLRPSLNWTPELGWTVPISEIGTTSCSSVRLVQPKNPGFVKNNDSGTSEKSSLKFSSASVSSYSVAASLPPEILLNSSVSKIKKSIAEPSKLSSHSLETGIMKKHSGDVLSKQKTETSSIKNDGTQMTSFSDRVSVKCLDKHSGDIPSKQSIKNDGTEYTRLSDSVSVKRLDEHSGDMPSKRKNESSSTKNDDTEMTSFSDKRLDKCESVSAGNVASREQYNSCGSLKRLRKSETELNSTFSESIESSIMDLEELVNKVIWLKGALHKGAENSNTMKPSWKFLETRTFTASGLEVEDETQG